ncbi:hypothetical protein MTO96_027300 [Rhipicephalus appendiculatus]
MAKIGSGTTTPERSGKTGSLLMSNSPSASQLYASGSNVETTEELSSTVFLDVNACLRLPLFFVNMIVMLLGLLGFWSSLYALRPEIPAFFISMVVFSIAAVGFLGALRENVCLLTAYIRLLTAVAILQALAAVLVFFLPSWARSYVAQSVSQDMIAAYRDDANLQSFVDWMQVEYRCCGISAEGFRDWNHNPYFACNKTNDSRERCDVPPSCCRRNDTSDDAGPAAERHVREARVAGEVSDQAAWTRVYTRSCSDAVFSRMQDHAMPASLILLGLCLVTLFLASLAIGTREQVLTLDAIYDIYYRRLEKGQARMEARNTTGLRVAEARRASREAEHSATNFWELLGGDNKGGDNK